MEKIRLLFIFFLSWRLFLFLPLFLGYFFISYQTGSSYTNLWHFTKPYFPVDNFFLFPWANFDGVHYLSIAGGGYQPDGTNSRFFPLFPLLINFVSRVFGRGETFGAIQFFSGLFLANLFFFLSLFVFYKLLRLDYPQKIVRLAVIFLLIFPTSFYFAGIYSESLFLFLALSSFYFARKGNWFWAGFFGMLLSATRVVGIIIFPVLLYEFFLQKKTKNFYPLLLVPLGLIFYSLFNLRQFGDAFSFLNNQEQVANARSVGAIVFPLQTIFRYFKILTTLSVSQFEWWIALLEISTFIFVGFLLYLGFQKKVRLSYLLFAVLGFLPGVLSGTFSALPRYVLVLFPLFLILALIKNKKAQVLYVIISLTLLILLLMFFSRGYFIA